MNQRFISDAQLKTTEHEKADYQNPSKKIMFKCSNHITSLRPRIAKDNFTEVSEAREAEKFVALPRLVL